jgi:hypothetical protein
MRLAGPSVLALVALLGCAAEAGGAGPTVTGYGISVTPPAGWHLRVTRGMLEAATTPLPRPDPTPSVSLGNALGRDDIGVLLFEDAPAGGVPFDAHAYSRSARRPFTRHDFDQPPPSSSNPGQHRFARRGIRLSGRYFALFVESGAGQPTPTGLAGLNLLVRSLQVTRGDFYPGTVAPARFPDEPGWHLRSSPRIPVGPETSTTSIAATVAYRDPLDAFPPRTTLARLPASGVIIYVTLVADNRNPPLASEHRAAGRIRLELPTAGCGSFEGIPAPQRATCALHIVVARHYVIQGWVIYGRANPTRAQQALAQAEFARLELPAWPLWRAS